MILILNTSEQVTGTLARYGTTNKVTPYFDDKCVVDLSTGAETFTFSTFANTKESTQVVGGNFVAFQEGNGYKLFQISEVTEEHTDEHIKTAYCEMAGIELINEILRATTLSSASLKQALTFALQDTEYQVGNIDASLVGVHTIELKDPIKAYNFIQQYIIGLYGAEISYRVEIKGGRIVGKYIDCYAERGDFKGIRFEYGKSINKVKKVADFTELATALVCQGKNGTTISSVEAPDKPAGQDWIGDEEAYQLYNKNGSHIFDVFKYDTESPAELLLEARKELANRCKPKLKYEVDVELLGAELNIGDTIYIIDNEFLPPLHLSARVSQIQKHRTDPSKDKVILANYKEVVSKITDEDRDLASLIDERFPIGSSDIKDGAVTSSKIPSNAVQSVHIKEDTITTDHLKAKVITSDKIDAGQIYAEHILADQIKTEHLKAESIDASKIKADAIESSHIKADAIESDHIKANQIQSKHIDSGSITTDHIQAGQVVSSHILANQIDANHIKANAITTDKIKAGAITTDKLEAGAITSDKILAGEINADHLATNSVTANKIQAGAISTDKLSANSVNADKIQANAVLTKHIKADQVEASHIKAGAITTDKILANAITSDKIGANQIQASHIKAGSIDASKVTTGELITTSAQIKTGIIGSAHIGNGQITNAHIGTGAIGSANILDGAITSAKITSASISNAHIKDATIEHGKIKSIDASKISTGTLDASKINVTNLKADSITAGSITVEGANIIHGSAFKSLDSWTKGGNVAIDTSRQHQGINSAKLVDSSNLYSEFIPARRGEAFVISAKAYVEAGTKPASNLLFILEEYTSDSTSRIDYQETQITNTVDAWQDYVKAWQVRKAETTRIRLRIYNRATGTTWVAKPMLSRGTIASIWKEHNDELISDGAITTDKLGDNAVDSTKLNLEELFVSEGAFINKLDTVSIKTSRLEVDEIRNDLINLSGMITFDSLDPKLNDLLFIKDADKTYINGNTILTNTIKASQIDLYNGLTVKKDGLDTFTVATDGSVKMSGTIESFGFSNEAGKEKGYRLTPEGDAYLNDAIVRGSVVLPKAGVTNYGGKGNPNLVKNSSITQDTTATSSKYWTIDANTCTVDTEETFEGANSFKISKSGLTGNSWEGFRQTLFAEVPAGKTYTISGYYLVKDKSKLDNTFALELKGDSPSTPLGSYPSFNASNCVEGQWTYFKYTITTTQAFTNVFLCGWVSKNGEVWFSNLKVEEGSEATPWTPYALENGDLVRFWAGASYEDRHNAPFRVLENGKIIATEGEFGGTFTGELSIGNILIKDTNTTSAEFSIKTNNNAKEVIRFTDNSAKFDVDVTIGNVLKASVQTKEIDFGDGVYLDLVKGQYNLSIGKNDSTTYNVYDLATTSGGSHKLMSKNGYGGLSFVASGTQVTAGSETPYDYKFARASSSEAVNVVIKGNLVVDNKITMADNNKIELVSISGSNSGIDFMIR